MRMSRLWKSEDFDLMRMVELYWRGRRDETWGDVQRFIDWFGATARQTPTALATWVSENEEQIVNITPLLADDLDQVERMFGRRWWGDEWIVVCRARSFYQWLSDMAPTKLEQALERDIDLEELDEMLEAKGTMEGGLNTEEIADGIPESHWWWWYPEAPPR